MLAATPLSKRYYYYIYGCCCAGRYGVCASVRVLCPFLCRACVLLHIRSGAQKKRKRKRGTVRRCCCSCPCSPCVLCCVVLCVRAGFGAVGPPRSCRFLLTQDPCGLPMTRQGGGVGPPLGRAARPLRAGGGREEKRRGRVVVYVSGYIQRRTTKQKRKKKKPQGNHKKQRCPPAPVKGLPGRGAPDLFPPSVRTVSPQPVSSVRSR